MLHVGSARARISTASPLGLAHGHPRRLGLQPAEAAPRTAPTVQGHAADRTGPARTSRQNTRVAAQARRLLPSTSGWLRASECIRAASFSAKLGYASSPNTVVWGRAAAVASRPRSRKATSSSTPAAISSRSSTVRWSGAGSGPLTGRAGRAALRPRSSPGRSHVGVGQIPQEAGSTRRKVGERG